MNETETRASQEARIRGADSPLAAHELAEFRERFAFFGMNATRELFTCLVLVWHEHETINDRVRELFDSSGLGGPTTAREFLEAYLDFYQATLGLVRHCIQQEDHLETRDMLLDLASVVALDGRDAILTGARSFEREMNLVAEDVRGTGAAYVRSRLSQVLGQIEAEDRPLSTGEIAEILLQCVLLSARFCRQRDTRGSQPASLYHRDSPTRS